MKNFALTAFILFIILFVSSIVYCQPSSTSEYVDGIEEYNMIQYVQCAYKKGVDKCESLMPNLDKRNVCKFFSILNEKVDTKQISHDARESVLNFINKSKEIARDMDCIK